jgi:hypothetical protein
MEYDFVELSATTRAAMRSRIDTLKSQLLDILSDMIRTEGYREEDVLCLLALTYGHDDPSCALSELFGLEYSFSELSEAQIKNRKILKSFVASNHGLEMDVRTE